jgi:hypothetical protein
MFSRIKLLLVPMPLLMKVEFIRYLNLQSLLSALLIKFSIGHLIEMVSFPFHGMAFLSLLALLSQLPCTNYRCANFDPLIHVLISMFFTFSVLSIL